jgi:hypothetical protein
MNNYFTDEQITDLANRTLGCDWNIYAVKEEVRDLMNLAVRTAIANPVAYLSKVYELPMPAEGLSNEMKQGLKALYHVSAITTLESPQDVTPSALHE